MQWTYEIDTVNGCKAHEIRRAHEILGAPVPAIPKAQESGTKPVDKSVLVPTLPVGIRRLIYFCMATFFSWLTSSTYSPGMGTAHMPQPKERA